VAHFASLNEEIRARLEARGIDPERSVDAWLEAIREGAFPLTPEGLPRRPRPYRSTRSRSLTPIPLAVVKP
jgi:hypothetical protein